MLTFVHIFLAIVLIALLAAGIVLLVLYFLHKRAEKNLRLTLRAEEVWKKTGDIEQVLALELPKEVRKDLEEAKKEYEQRQAVFPDYN